MATTSRQAMESWYMTSRKRQLVLYGALLVLAGYFLVATPESGLEKMDLELQLSFLRAISFFQNAFELNSLTIMPSPSLEPSPYDPAKLAFLVETRPIPHLPALFSHMVAVVPPEWRFMFMGSPEAITFMRASSRIAALEESRKLHILKLPSNYSLENRESVSQMFTDPHLYATIMAPAEHVLVFQPDSIFCTNSAETLNDWLEWDWVGAPWSATAPYAGNGGLSLRKVSKILKVLEKEQRKHGDGALEDQWLVDRIHALEGYHMPDATIAKHFSVESVWDDKPLGYHIGWLGVHHPQIWDDQAQVDHILKYCPEVKMLLGMKLDSDKPAGVNR